MLGVPTASPATRLAQMHSAPLPSDGGAASGAARSPLLPQIGSPGAAPSACSSGPAPQPAASPPPLLQQFPSGPAAYGQAAAAAGAGGGAGGLGQQPRPLKRRSLHGDPLAAAAQARASASAAGLVGSALSDAAPLLRSASATAAAARAPGEAWGAGAAAAMLRRDSSPGSYVQGAGIHGGMTAGERAAKPARPPLITPRARRALPLPLPLPPPLRAAAPAPPPQHANAFSDTHTHTHT